jgi:hypothetical protein
LLWPHGDPRAVARTIVADPRFHGSTSNGAPAPSLIGRVLGWIGERIGDIVRAIGHVLGARTPLNVAIGVVALAVAVAGLAFLIVRFVRLPARRRRAATTSIALERELTSAELIAQALAAARAERWHAAASALARAALHSLDERGRLRFDAARTPGEVRRVLNDPAFDAFEREATTALFAADAASAESFARLRTTYAAAFGEPV